jgi:hypothetical protein
VEELFISVVSVHRAADIKHREIHTTEPLVPQLRLLEVEIAIANLKKYRSLGSD